MDRYIILCEFFKHYLHSQHVYSAGFTTRVSAVEALRRTEPSAQQLLQHPFHLDHPRLTLDKNCHYRNATDAPLQRCWLGQTSHLRRQSKLQKRQFSSWVDFSTRPTLFFSSWVDFSTMPSNSPCALSALLPNIISMLRSAPASD